MDKINKALRKIPAGRLVLLMTTYEKIIAGDTNGVNLKPMRGHKQTFRIRSGEYRLVFKIVKDGEPIILFVGKRDDQTYRNF